MREIHAVGLLRLVISRKIVGLLLWLLVGMVVEVSLAVEYLSLAVIEVLILQEFLTVRPSLVSFAKVPLASALIHLIVVLVEVISVWL